MNGKHRRIRAAICLCFACALLCVPAPANAETASVLTQKEVQTSSQNTQSMPLEKAPITTTSTIAANKTFEQILQDELIVSYDADTNLKTVSKKIGIKNVKIEILTNGVCTTNSALMRFNSHKKVLQAAAKLKKNTHISSVSYNAAVHATSAVNDKYAFKSYYLKQEAFKAAWSNVKTQGAVTVAVLDSGITMKKGYRNKDLRKNVDYAHAYDALNDKVLASNFVDSYEHGTQVASVIAARANNNLGIAGASYNAKVLPIRMLDDEGCGTWAAAHRAFNYILNMADELNIKVINMSFCAIYNDQELETLVEKAYDRGILCVASAGNYGSKTKQYPASYDHVISVGAVNKKEKAANFSEHNKTLDIVAAGTHIYVPHQWTTVVVYANGNKTGYNNYYFHTKRYTYVGGTSFSAPIVAGAAALLFTANPGLSCAGAYKALTQSAKDAGKRGKDSHYGYGILCAAASVISVSTPALSIKESASCSITVKWKRLAGIKGYKISWNKNGSATQAKYSVLGSARHSYTITGLAKNSKYSIKIRAWTNKSHKKVWSKSSAISLETSG